MKKQLFLGMFLLYGFYSSSGQEAISGDLTSIIETIIDDMPGTFTDEYAQPSDSQLEAWEELVTDMINGNYGTAASSATDLGYELVELTDDETVYYLLRKTDASVNYWGTYVINPEACRRYTVIQAPHPKFDTNTGKQGVYVFEETESYAFFLAGTHRCNNSSFSECSGTTTACSSDSQSFKISDMAHNDDSPFYTTTKVMKDLRNPYFIQLHGFSKQSTDPSLIMSNGARVLAGSNKLDQIKEYLAAEDATLTFKVAHEDTDWSRLVAFTNTQGRYINDSAEPCGTAANSANGRFIHIEQEYTKMRLNQSTWSKMVNAINDAFDCETITGVEDDLSDGIVIFPNPANDYFQVETGNYATLQLTIYNALGEEVMNCEVSSAEEVPVSTWGRGLYYYRLSDQNQIIKTGKLIKK